MKSISPTQEQLDIIKAISDNNVVVNSCVGAGKSSSILFVAEKYPNEKILLLTYNKRLKFETRSRSTHIKNLETHSFHSFCVSYFDKNCYTDFGILNYLKSPNQQIIQQFNYDIIIIDEAQDLNPLYYEVVCKINKINEHSAKYCVIGDVYQSIYQYNNSDSRYILNANLLFNFNKLNWSYCYLTETFRLTRQMTSFINNCVFNESSEKDKIDKAMDTLGRPTLISTKESKNKVRYHICDQFDSKISNNEISMYLKKGYKYQDIFVLAPSLKSNKTPINILANKLTSQKIPIYCSTSDTDQLDTDIIANKIVFCSFHQVKGLERKVVLVFGFDDSYFKYYKKDSPINEIPSEVYVAITRSSECLSLFHHYKNDYFPFISNLKNYTEFFIHKEISVKKDFVQKNFVQKQISVSNLLRHIPIEIIAECLENIKIKEISPKGTLINLQNKITQTYGSSLIYENVSDINGIVIPCYYEYLNTGTYTVDNLVNERTHKIIKGKINKFKVTTKDLEFRSDDEDTQVKVVDKDSVTIQKILYQATKWSSISNGYIFKSNQISEYNWLTKDQLNKCADRLKQWISVNAEYEIFYTKLFNDDTLCGYIDCIDNDILWEFKCTDTIDNLHILQVTLYMFLTKEENFKSYRILNILTSQVIEIEVSKDSLESIVTKLLHYKNKSIDYISSKKFIENNLIIKNKYI